MDFPNTNLTISRDSINEDFIMPKHFMKHEDVAVDHCDISEWVLCNTIQVNIYSRSKRWFCSTFGGS